MTMTQFVLVAFLMLAALVTGALVWQTALARGFEFGNSAHGTAMTMRQGRFWRHHLCGEADPSLHIESLMRLAKHELGLSSVQSQAMQQIEPKLTALVAKLRAAGCVMSPPDVGAPQRLAILAENVEMVAEELHMLQPDVARFYELLDDQQKQRFDAFLSSKWRRS